MQATPEVLLSVTDAMGRTVWQGATTGAESVLDLRGQAAGLYLLKLRWPAGHSRHYKLVRQ